MPRLSLALLGLFIVVLTIATDVLFAESFGSNRGLWLAGIGLALILAEFITFSKGVLSLMGLVMFGYGTVVLTASNDPSLHLTWPVVVILNLLVWGIVAFCVWAVIRGYNVKNDGIDNPRGLVAQVIAWDGDDRRVSMDGAVWRAAGTGLYRPGDKVVVTGQDNITLHIAPYGETSQ